MVKAPLAPVLALILLGMTWGEAASQKATRAPILSVPLATLDIKDPQIVTARGKPRGTLAIGMHFGLDPGWLDPLSLGSSKYPWRSSTSGRPRFTMIRNTRPRLP